MKVAVIYGGPSPEAEISRKSAKSVIFALKKLGHQVFELELDENITEKLKQQKPDKVFIALHGSPGEDGTVQGLLEIAGYNYTGCNTQTSAICMDKDITKRVLKTYNIPVPAGETFFQGDKIEPVEIPCVVKPARTGSTVGISVVKDENSFQKAVEEAFKYDSKIIIEEYIEGREITVAVLNGFALPPVEIVTETGFYDFDSKYKKQTTEYKVPANLNLKLQEKLKKISEKIFKVLECSGAIRIDFRIDKWNNPYVLEVNTIPGMTERSLLPKAANAAGIPFEKLIEEILES
ncbi:D-alanine--D-alanine ligase [Desulfurobacterium thermolithotrophum]|uniref:D-alanine--D-alanine ligase family protein n=1 Tax=Desulfurobacterium thermolithotrophum TaxID=64160 RepID=UPI0013D2C34A|nr:D-alanine--D-alanine ligase [Desulfurobacterium thermolithotrophum]